MILYVLRNLRVHPISASAQKPYLTEIAWIVVPTDWAMCKVLWYCKVLAAHPHGCPHSIHIFCGHRESEPQGHVERSPFPSRSFVQMTPKRRSESGVPRSRLAFVPWSEEVSAHRMKTRYVAYRCCCVIHHSSFCRGD